MLFRVLPTPLSIAFQALIAAKEAVSNIEPPPVLWGAVKQLNDQLKGKIDDVKAKSEDVKKEIGALKTELAVHTQPLQQCNSAPLVLSAPLIL